MNDSFPTGATCGPEGCDETTAATSIPADAAAGTRIDIVSDAICPWCYIGKRQLERALE
ncbi:MAG: DsbA family protein, partial [Rhodospirillales bacterium]|nr:DsbA family protein [Rhodospirillales bacterium]